MRMSFHLKSGCESGSFETLGFLANPLRTPRSKARRQTSKVLSRCRLHLPDPDDHCFVRLPKLRRVKSRVIPAAQTATSR
ncbi:hypothetical protein RB213_005105, partial [Colletotrichum asianum]